MKLVVKKIVVNEVEKDDGAQFTNYIADLEDADKDNKVKIISSQDFEFNVGDTIKLIISNTQKTLKEAK